LKNRFIYPLPSPPRAGFGEPVGALNESAVRVALRKPLVGKSDPFDR
jgi:hypothetical protein